jgi:hypothetical protein
MEMQQAADERRERQKQVERLLLPMASVPLAPE